MPVLFLRCNESGFVIVYREIHSRNLVTKWSQHTDDAALIAACIHHDRMAQEALYQKFFDDAYRTCNRYLSQYDDIMSVVNEGFLKVFQNLTRYDRQLGPAGAWIHRIMVNTAIDHIRKEKRSPVLNEWSDETTIIAVNNDALSSMATEEILQLVKNLPPVTRTVFNFAVMEGYAHKDIAEVLDISEGTSRWHLSEAKKRLQQMICDKEKTIKLHEEKTYN